MLVTLAQINPTVGNIEENTNKICQIVDTQTQSDIIVFPECSLIGYPAKDILLYPYIYDKLNNAIKKVINHSKKSNSCIVIGTPYADNNTHYNAALAIQKGTLLHTQYKQLIPSYDVFDETRYFSSGTSHQPFTFKNKKIGLTLCEDIWGHNYDKNPINELKECDIIINLSASPFEETKLQRRVDLIKKHCKQTPATYVYVNQVGGNDDLIFDGNSFVIDKHQQIICQAKAFEESIVSVNIEKNSPQQLVSKSPIENISKALSLGIKDYTEKCGFKSVLLGLSGGIDSAVTCVLAVNALGKENVLGVTMPSMYSSKGSISDSKKLAKNLGITCIECSITSTYQSLEKTLSPQFNNKASDLTEENLQARIRGVLLMALSNKHHKLLLTTGNKSELAIGYCTLYGDMCGGLAVISDLPKTTVYKLAHHLNKPKAIIPKNTLTKAPSAELRPNQTDQDSLPDYTTLDAILHLAIEKHASQKDIVKQGYNPKTVKDILNKIKRCEYKRQQAPIGLKVSSKAFGSGWKFPVASKW